MASGIISVMFLYKKCQPCLISYTPTRLGHRRFRNLCHDAETNRILLLSSWTISLCWFTHYQLATLLSDTMPIALIQCRRQDLLLLVLLVVWRTEGSYLHVQTTILSIPDGGRKEFRPLIQAGHYPLNDWDFVWCIQATASFLPRAIVIF